MIPALRDAAREFFDALGPSNPLAGREREFWLVLFALVVDDTTKPADLTDDIVLAIYATELAIDFLELAPAFPAPRNVDAPGAALAAHQPGSSVDGSWGRPLVTAGNGARTVALGVQASMSDSESGPGMRGAA